MSEPQRLNEEKIKTRKKARDTVVSVFVFTAILFLFTLIVSSMLIETGKYYGNNIHVGFGAITLAISILFLIPIVALIIGFKGFENATNAITEVLMLKLENKGTIDALTTVAKGQTSDYTSYLQSSVYSPSSQSYQSSSPYQSSSSLQAYQPGNLF